MSNSIRGMKILATKKSIRLINRYLIYFRLHNLELVNILYRLVLVMTYRIYLTDFVFKLIYNIMENQELGQGFDIKGDVYEAFTAYLNKR